MISKLKAAVLPLFLTVFEKAQGQETEAEPVWFSFIVNDFDD